MSTTGLADGATHAISDAEAAAAFRLIERYAVVVLGVSGGPDSLALLLLAARWAAKRRPEPPLPGSPRLVALTFDHRFRAGSAAEAMAVADVARELGIVHEIAVWQGERPARGLQEAARARRYAALADVARRALAEDGACGPAAVVTAHSSDDQAETVVMHLARGSGVDGLAGIPERRPLADGVDVVRPLLGFCKARLEATLTAAGLDWARDPSNADRSFERVRVREALVALGPLGVDPLRLAESARRVARAREALGIATEELAAGALRCNRGAFATILRRPLEAAACEIRLRLLAGVIARFGGATPAPRLSEVERLEARLSDRAFRGATLGGAAVRRQGDAIVVFREPGRLRAPELIVPARTTVVWDGRFEIHNASASDPVAVGIRGAARPAGPNEDDPWLVEGAPAAAIEGLPWVRSVAGGPVLLRLHDETGAGGGRGRETAGANVTIRFLRPLFTMGGYFSAP